MKRFACPSCGAEVPFQSAASVYAVCPYCTSMLVRTDVDVAAIGTMAALPDDMSPLQLGSEGRHEGEAFGVVGRLKVGWRDGMWNEWHILMESGRRGWIGEAQGSFSISFDQEAGLPEAQRRLIDERLAPQLAQDPPDTPWVDRPPLRFGGPLEIALGDARLRAVDIKRALCLGSEGELPFPAPRGRKTVAIDCLGADGSFATVEIEGETMRVYGGRTVEWDELRLSNLRPLEGW